MCVLKVSALCGVQKVEALEGRLLASPLHKNPQLETLYNLCQKKAEVRAYTAYTPIYHFCLSLIHTRIHTHTRTHTNTHTHTPAGCGGEVGQEGVEEGTERDAYGGAQVQKESPQKASNHQYVLVIVQKSSCTRYNGTRGGVEIVIQYEAQRVLYGLLRPATSAIISSTA